MMVVAPCLGTLVGPLPDDANVPWGHTFKPMVGASRPSAAARLGPCPLQCKALQLQCTIGGPSWTIRSRSGCPLHWVGRFGEHRAASDAGLQTSFAWRSKHS